MVKSSIHVLFLNKNWRKLTKKLQNKKKRAKYSAELETIIDNEDETIKRYPIHVACMNGITKHALKAILQVYPGAAKLVDDEGSTPLHYILHYDDRCKIDVLKVLLNAYPEALGVQDKFGCTPMFHAVEHKIGVEMEKLALLLNHDAAIEALTVTCQSAGARKDRRVKRDYFIHEHRHGSLKLSYTRANPKAQDVGSVELYDTAPIYKIWDLALLRISSERNLIHYTPNKEDLSRRKQKKAGKRVQKAEVMLEALYLKKHFDSQQKRITELESYLQTSTQDQLSRSLHLSGLDNDSTRQANSERPTCTKKGKWNNIPDKDSTRHTNSERPTCTKIFKKQLNTCCTASLAVAASARNTFVRCFGKWNNILDKDSTRHTNQERLTIRKKGIWSRFKNHKKSQIYPDEDIENKLEDVLRRKLKEIEKRDSYARLFGVELGPTKFRVLHAVLTFHTHLPDVAYDHAMIHYSNQVNEKEERTGNLPLHIACRMRDNSAFCRDSVLTELLDLNVDAAKTKNCRGQLPLHIALSAEDPWSFESIMKLLEANPTCYNEVDRVSNLHPFQLAAVKRKNSECDQLSCIYTLLRKSPSLAKWHYYES